MIAIEMRQGTVIVTQHTWWYLIAGLALIALGAALGGHMAANGGQGWEVARDSIPLVLLGVAGVITPFRQRVEIDRVAGTVRLGIRSVAFHYQREHPVDGLRRVEVRPGVYTTVVRLAFTDGRGVQLFTVFKSPFRAGPPAKAMADAIAIAKRLQLPIAAPRLAEAVKAVEEPLPVRPHPAKTARGAKGRSR